MPNVLFKNRHLLESLILPFLIYKEQQLIFANKFLSKLNYEKKCKSGLCGTITTYDDTTKKISSIITYDYNIPNGPYAYYKSGHLLEDGVFLNGHKHGEVNVFYADDLKTQWHLLKKKYTYTNSKLNGEFISWYPNGYIHQHCYYLNDKLNGQFRQWSEHIFSHNCYTVNNRDYWNKLELK